MKANSKQDQLISAGKGKVKTLNGSDKFIFVISDNAVELDFKILTCISCFMIYCLYSLIGKDTDTTF